MRFYYGQFNGHDINRPPMFFYHNLTRGSEWGREAYRQSQSRLFPHIFTANKLELRLHHHLRQGNSKFRIT
ncbi:hypothetical protein, partial [Microseira wollei]|uniref:hypothetical protein n=1 Tax=Microseira wollei TaxID=467598 RepID=UPI001CFF3B7A